MTLEQSLVLAPITIVVSVFTTVLFTLLFEHIKGKQK